MTKAPLVNSSFGSAARILELLVLAVFVLLFIIVPDGATPWVLGVNLGTFYALFLRAIAVPDRIVPWLPSYLSIEVLFFGFSYLIFYHPYQLYLLGISDLRVSRFIANSFADGSNEAITLATVGMLSFTSGYRFLDKAIGDVSPNSSRLRKKRPHGQDPSSHYFGAMTNASSALLLALVAVYLLAGWRSAGEGRYTGTTTQGLGIEGVSVTILMFCMIVAALWVHALAAGLRTPPMLVVGLITAVLWNMRLLVLGDRSAFLLFILVLAGGYFTFVRKASRLVLALAFGLGMFIYSTIEVLRFVPNWYRSGNILELLINSQNSQESSSESSFNVTTMTLRATVEAVPDMYDHMYGVLKLIQLSSIIPFSGKLYLPYLDLEYTHSAEMLGDIMLGSGATWNTGTNVISDAYIDFGVPGVLVILFAVGLLAKAVRNYVAIEPNDVRRVVLYLLAMALLAELPRYSIDLPIRSLAWTFIFCAVVGTITQRFGRGDTSLAPLHDIHDRSTYARRQRS